MPTATGLRCSRGVRRVRVGVPARIQATGLGDEHPAEAALYNYTARSELARIAHESGVGPGQLRHLLRQARVCAVVGPSGVVTGQRSVEGEVVAVAPVQHG